jgi:hypothetical protein
LGPIAHAMGYHYFAPAELASGPSPLCEAPGASDFGFRPRTARKGGITVAHGVSRGTAAGKIRNARTRTIVTVRRRLEAHIIDAPCPDAKGFRHASSMLEGAQSFMKMHENASLGCGSHCLRGKGENHASLASGSHCLREIPCILAGRIGRARCKCLSDSDLRKIFKCRNHNGV